MKMILKTNADVCIRADYRIYACGQSATVIAANHTIPRIVNSRSQIGETLSSFSFTRSENNFDSGNHRSCKSHSFSGNMWQSK